MKLYKKTDLLYYLEGRDRSLKDLFKYADQLGINKDDLEYGLFEMVKYDHNMVEFGDIHGKFIFSKKIEN